MKVKIIDADDGEVFFHGTEEQAKAWWWDKLIQTNNLGGYEATFAGKAPAPSKPIRTLSQYLKSIGKAGGYVDKRKDHYRVKTTPFTPSQLKILNAIEGVEACNEKRSYYSLLFVRTFGIIRCKNKITETLMAK